MSLFRDQGVVLRTYRLGEADRIIVFLTEHHGKVRAVAKGVRRTGSKFGARLEPLTHASLMLWQGRGDLDIVNQVEVIDSFRTVREDLPRVAQGFAVLEVTDQLAQERHADPRLYLMLVRALRTLADPDQNPALLAAAFFLKALVLEGCASCGRPDGEVELVAFDLLEGGALCRGCRRGRPLSTDGLALLRRILGGSLGAVLHGDSPPGTEEVAALATEAMENHLDRRLRSIHSASSF